MNFESQDSLFAADSYSVTIQQIPHLVGEISTCELICGIFSAYVINLPYGVGYLFFKKNMKQKKEYALAVLTIREAEIMPIERRKEIAEWLRKQAKGLLKQGSKYTNRFTARFIV